MNTKFQIPFGTKKGGLILAAVFGVATAFLTIIGFWRTLLIAVLSAAGYYIGSSANLKGGVITGILQRLLQNQNGNQNGNQNNSFQSNEKHD